VRTDERPNDSGNGAGRSRARGSGGFDRGPRRRVLGLVSVREKQGESVEGRREDWRQATGEGKEGKG
jgi:hypothetical protein